MPRRRIPKRKIFRKVYRINNTVNSTSVVNIDLITADEEMTLIRTIINLQQKLTVNGSNDLDSLIHVTRNGKVVADLPTSSMTQEDIGDIPNEELLRFKSKFTNDVITGAGEAYAASFVEKEHKFDLKSQRKLRKNDTVRFTYVAGAASPTMKQSGYIVTLYKRT